MTSNVKQFVVDVRNGVRQFTRDNFLLFHKAVHFEAAKRVAQKTPVDKGPTRANWQSTVGAPATTIRQGMGAAPDPIFALASLEPFGISYITNNMPHILVLEEGGFVPPDPGPSKDRRPSRKGRTLVRGGFSVQAPEGMVGVTVQELEGMVRE